MSSSAGSGSGSGSGRSMSGTTATSASSSSPRPAKDADVPAIELSFKDVKAWVPNYKETQSDGTKAVVTRSILKGVSGTVRSGGLTMLMGASGAGKSTFFDVVAHRTSSGVHHSGSIKVNGREFTLEDFQNNAAYVTQDSFFVGDLTVRETLEFQCSLRLPTSIGADERRARVEDALALLRLVKYSSAKARDLNTANRKKLSIACAVLAKPLLLFCDEPTTSLDATTARSVIASLREVAAKRHVLIFCTIHQPSVHVFRMFDTALVMALGQMAYEGPVAELVPRLAAAGHECPTDTNPADFVIELLSAKYSDTARVEAVQGVIDSLRASSGASDARGDSADEAAEGQRLEGSNRPNPLSLVWHLFRRDLRVATRNEKALQANIGQSIMLGLVLGFLYFQSPRNQAGANDRVGYMFLVSANSMFLSIQSSIMIAVSERAVFLKEVSEGSYNSLEYLVAKALVLIPFQALYTALFAATGYFIVGLQSDFINWLHFALLLFLVSLCGSAFGLMISVATGDVATANALTPAIGIPAMLFSGFVVSVNSIPVWLRWIRYISMVRYSLSGLMINELDGLTFKCLDSERLPSGACPISTGAKLLEDLKATENGKELWPRYVGLCSIYVLALVSAYIVMVYKAQKAKRG